MKIILTLETSGVTDVSSAFRLEFVECFYREPSYPQGSPPLHLMMIKKKTGLL